MEGKKLVLLGFKFFMHLVFGTVLFILCLVPAVLLNIFLHKLSGYGIDQTLQYMFIFVEYFIVFTDFCVYIVFILREALNLGREIWSAK
jgi:hypothetical protein